MWYGWYVLIFVLCFIGDDVVWLGAADWMRLNGIIYLILYYRYCDIDIILLIICYRYLNIDYWCNRQIVGCQKSGTYADIEEDEHIDKYQYIIYISINLNMISLTYHA